MTQQLNDVVTAAGFADRRRTEPRSNCDRDVSLLLCGSEDTSHFIRAHITDCSAHGLGLFLPQKVEAGQQILARVDVDRHPMLLLYTIRYCIPTKADEFRAGARFNGYVASRFRGSLEHVVAGLTG